MPADPACRSLIQQILAKSPNDQRKKSVEKTGWASPSIHLKQTRHWSLATRKSLSDRIASIDGLRRVQRPAQVRRLRVGASLKPGTPAGIGFAGREELLEALRPSEGIQGFERLEPVAGPLPLFILAGKEYIARHGGIREGA